MRVVFVVFLPLVLCSGAVLAQSGPKPSTPVPAAKSQASPSGKDSRADSIAECMRLWDSATHMTKQEWSRTCQRIQTRLENLKIENLGTMPKTAPKKKGGG